MSQIVEIVHELYEATWRGDLDAFLGLHDPDATLIPLILDIEGGEYQGQEGVRRFWSEIHSAFPDWHWEAERVRVLDQAALVTVHIRGRAKGSGVTIDQRAWHVLKLRHGKVFWWRVFRLEQEALEAVGLQEQAEVSE